MSTQAAAVDWDADVTDLTRSEIIETIERANELAKRIPSHYPEKAKAHATINRWITALEQADA